MKKLLIGLLALSSISTYASSNLTTLVDTDCPDCNYAPIETTLAFTFEAATANFNRANPISPAELIGNWKQVAGAQVADVFGASSMMGYDTSGIKQSDGNILTLLSSSTDVQTGFFEHPKDSITIEIKNLGNGSQGPYIVKFNEAGQACFSIKGYGPGNIFYAYECRKVQKNNSKILCAVTFNSNGTVLTSIEKPYDGKIVFYLGFARK